MAQGAENFPQFILDLGFVGNGFGDFRPQNLAITLSEAMDGHFDGCLAHTQPGR